MRKNAVVLICVLFYANVVPIVAETPEITDARIAGKNDAKGFKWKWFAAGYMTANVSVIVVALVESLNNNYLDGSLDAIAPACWYTLYGAYLLTPTAVALIKSPAPQTDLLLGKSPEWVNCTAYGFLDHSLKEDCATITISLKGVIRWRNEEDSRLSLKLKLFSKSSAV